MRKHHPYPRGSLGAQLRENSVVVMRRRSGVEQTSNLFTFFKPVSSPSTSSATQSTKKSGVHSKSKDISDECITMATDEATPTPSGRKRPHTSDSDSDGDIGIRKTPAGRPKRMVAMTPSGRRKERAKARRRSAVLESDDEEDEEYNPETEEEASHEGESDGEGIVTPAKKKQRRDKPFTTPKTRGTPVATPRTRGGSSRSVVKSTNSPSILLTPSPSPHTPHTPTIYLHDKLEWLQPENIKDKFGKNASHPDYNPRSLKVPADFLRAASPAMRQWWKMKTDNFDTVLMFKVGKFYELYHMDAVLGVQELGLAYMKGDFAHSGFPEIAFGRYAQTLIQKGYKVARVEQTETPQMVETRCKKMATPTKHDKVVRREICSIVTKGTCTLSFSDGVESATEAAFLLAIKEKIGETPIYGVCFVDTTIGQFHLGQFSDDRQCSRLRTLISHYQPAHFLYERHNLSSRTQQVMKQLLGSCLQDALSPNTEFWSSNRTLKTLAEEGYFKNDDIMCEWPEILKNMLAEDDSLRLTAKDDSDLVISALGACVHCLTRCLIDRDLLSMRSFTRYEPVDTLQCGNHDNTLLPNQRMVLDGITLGNLDILDNRGQLTGSLLERLDHCSTPFGKRLLKQWLCAPLCDPRAIHDRLDAMATLLSHTHLIGEAREVLKILPDLQRLLRQIHGMGMRRPDSAHPDNRATLYEEATYSKRRINGFLSVLEGFKTASELPSLFNPILTSDSPSSSLLKRVLCLEKDGGLFPDLTQQLNFFSTSFDHTKAKKEGTIIPARGVNQEYDVAMDTIKSTRVALDEYLRKQRKRLGCSNIMYWGTGRNRFQLEIPESALDRQIPDDYELKSQKKGYRRYWTREIEKYLEVTMAAEDDKQQALRDTMRKIFHAFIQHFRLWESAVQCLATIDVLLSLAIYSSLSDGEMCRPMLVSSPVPFLDIRDGRHPCVSHTYTGDDYIPNDVIINGGRSQDGCLVVVVTGPNMGGKSTLMRQTGLIVILAQLGCYVPATSCTLTPVDRVFTRIGASDRITSGESTFFVELSETSTILKHATTHSLVLIDELGRGTATYDGTAIASAVLRELSVSVACRTLFSTHYHNILDGLHGNLKIALGHMACMIENEDTGREGEGDGDGEGEGCREESITFLYKFIEGACPKSYGFNAAKLAGLPTEVIRAARRKAREFEYTTIRMRILRELVRLGPDYPLEKVALLQSRLRHL